MPSARVAEDGGVLVLGPAHELHDSDCGLTRALRHAPRRSVAQLLRVRKRTTLTRRSRTPRRGRCAWAPLV
jgi:hypothetical protein